MLDTIAAQEATAPAARERALSRLTRLKISAKVPLIVVAAAVTLAMGSATTDYFSASSEMESQVKQRLSAVAEGRRAALTDYLTSIEQDMAFVAANPTTVSALQDFMTGWLSMGADPKASLQQLYVHANPQDRKEELDAAPDELAQGRLEGAPGARCGASTRSTARRNAARPRASGARSSSGAMAAATAVPSSRSASATTAAAWLRSRSQSYSRRASPPSTPRPPSRARSRSRRVSLTARRIRLISSSSPRWMG